MGNSGGHSGGGSTPGAAIVRKFAFAYNTGGSSAALAAGVAIYTPTVGDVLLDAWIEIDTAWNGLHSSTSASSSSPASDC